MYNIYIYIIYKYGSGHIYIDINTCMYISLIYIDKVNMK